MMNFAVILCSPAYMSIIPESDSIPCGLDKQEPVDWLCDVEQCYFPIKSEKRACRLVCV